MAEIQKIIGSKIPLTNSKYGYFNPSIETIDQLKSNIKNLILTNKGERVMMPEFGCGVKKLIFEPMTFNELEDEIKNEIIVSIRRWIPNVVINKIFIDYPEDKQNAIRIDIRFTSLPSKESNDLNITLFKR